MNHNHKIGIVGGAGYAGGELLRVLLHHPAVSISFIQSRSQAGLPVHAVHTDLIGETDLVFTSKIDTAIDLLFLCVGHQESKEFLTNNQLSPNTKIIDLSQDFRLQHTSIYGDGAFIYGLPELSGEKISAAKYIANPGCFATAIQLALLPLAQQQLLGDEIHITGITGATGAGQKLQATGHFAWRANNIQAYKSLQHQHMAEVSETLAGLQPNLGELNFMPWRGDFTRGIYISAYTRTTISIEQAYALYHDFYDPHPYTHVTENMVHLKQVVNTNKCLLHLEKTGDKFIVHSAIDNLLKGASGQAVQNMNLMFGLPETTGLQLKPVSF